MNNQFSLASISSVLLLVACGPAEQPGDNFGAQTSVPPEMGSGGTSPEAAGGGAGALPGEMCDQPQPRQTYLCAGDAYEETRAGLKSGHIYPIDPAYACQRPSDRYGWGGYPGGTGGVGGMPSYGGCDGFGAAGASGPYVECGATGGSGGYGGSGATGGYGGYPSVGGSGAYGGYPGTGAAGASGPYVEVGGSGAIGGSAGVGGAIAIGGSGAYGGDEGYGAVGGSGASYGGYGAVGGSGAYGGYGAVGGSGAYGGYGAVGGSGAYGGYGATGAYGGYGASGGAAGASGGTGATGGAAGGTGGGYWPPPGGEGTPLSDWCESTDPNLQIGGVSYSVGACQDSELRLPFRFQEPYGWYEITLYGGPTPCDRSHVLAKTAGFGTGEVIEFPVDVADSAFLSVEFQSEDWNVLSIALSEPNPNN